MMHNFSPLLVREVPRFLATFYSRRMWCLFFEIKSATNFCYEKVFWILPWAVSHLYLGVPLFLGRPWQQPITNRIKAKLSKWKGSLLSIMGRVQLVKFVIHCILLYSFDVYSWSVSLLKQFDLWIKTLFRLGTFIKEN